MTRTIARLLPLPLLLLLASCARDWHMVREEESVRVETLLHVRTEPEGASVSVNGSFRGESPLKVRLIYRYRRMIWARERSYVFKREPEERMVPEYFNNRFVISVTKPGFEDAAHELKLEGEREKEIHFPLKPDR
jgi:hypothetical protein